MAFTQIRDFGGTTLRALGLTIYHAKVTYKAGGYEGQGGHLPLPRFWQLTLFQPCAMWGQIIPTTLLLVPL